MATENKDLSAFDKQQVPDAKNIRFGIVVADWNSEITEALYSGAYATLLECGAKKKHIVRWDVPGSFEMAHACKKMASDQKVDAVIAIGSVIQGETKPSILYAAPPPRALWN